MSEILKKKINGDSFFFFFSVDSQSNVVLIPESFLTPSPEEQIIRQRSRRHTIQPQVLVFDDIESKF